MVPTCCGHVNAGNRPLSKNPYGVGILDPDGPISGLSTRMVGSETLAKGCFLVKQACVVASAAREHPCEGSFNVVHFAEISSANEFAMV